MSEDGTPFIPPISSPLSGSPVRAPVVPIPYGCPNSSEASMPGWVQPAGYTPNFVPAPFASPPYGTPFVPGQSMQPSPAIFANGLQPQPQPHSQPGSYFQAPVNLPGGTPRSTGLSVDYIGFGMGSNAANLNVPQQQRRRQQQQQQMQAPQLPPQPQPPAWAGMPPQTPFVPPGTGFIQPQAFPQYGVPMGIPMQGGWMGAFPGVSPFMPPHMMMMPGMGGATPMFAPGPMPGLAPPAFATAQPPANQRPGNDLFIAEKQQTSDLHGRLKWSAGKNYGPVLTPFLLKVVNAEIAVNPLLSSPRDDKEIQLVWNMLHPSVFCMRSNQIQSRRSWMHGRNDPATFPRVTNLQIISDDFPWTIDIKAGDSSIGVTCGDLIDQLSHQFDQSISKHEHGRLSGAKQEELKRNYRYNRSTAPDVPGGRLGDHMRKLDWLGTVCWFGGVVRDDKLVENLKDGVVMPATLVLRCARKNELGLSARELR